VLHMGRLMCRKSVTWCAPCQKRNSGVCTVPFTRMPASTSCNNNHSTTTQQQVNKNPTRIQQEFNKNSPTTTVCVTLLNTIIMTTPAQRALPCTRSLTVCGEEVLYLILPVIKLYTYCLLYWNTSRNLPSRTSALREALSQQF
jgi:hypothetical protein